MTVNFVILGEPKGKGRPKFSKRGNYVTTRTPDETVIYENLVRTEYALQNPNVKFDDDIQLRVRVNAFYAIPKSASNKKRISMNGGETRPIKKPDADNILKVVCDALNNIAYRDDAQIVEALVCKYYSEQPRVEVTIRNI